MKLIRRIIIVLVVLGLISVGFYLWYSDQHKNDESLPVQTEVKK
jgi:hypothetical protein